MLNGKTISDINQAFLASPHGFLVVDSGQPAFAVLPFSAYQELKKAKIQSPLKRQKILVTGGAGYIGSVTSQALIKAGHEVVVFDNLSTGRREAVANCQLVVGDLADSSALDKVFSEHKFDAVVHFAASTAVEESVGNPAKYYQNNVVNSLNLVDAMVRHNVSKIIFSSSAAVYGESVKQIITEDTPCLPANPYGQTKLEFENILKSYRTAHGMSSVSLRYFNAAGAVPEMGLGYDRSLKHTHLIPRVLDAALGKTSEINVFGKDYATPDGTCVRDFVHVLDLASAHLAALQKLDRDPDCYVYNVGTGIGYSVLEIIDSAMEITGRMIPMKFVGRRPGDPAKLIADSRKLQTELGWKPEHDLKSILESSWEWQKSA